MFQRIAKSLEILLMSACVLFSIAILSHPATADGNGIVKVASAYPMAETIDRIKADIAKKGVMFFDQIDQQKLAAKAGISLRPSTLLIFGNRLPSVMRSLGKSVTEFKKGVNEIEEDVDKAVTSEPKKPSAPMPD